MSDAFTLTADLAPLGGLTPGRHGTAEGPAGLTITPVSGQAIVLIQPFDQPATEAALAGLGYAWPSTGRVTTGAAGAMAWGGLDKAYAMAAQQRPGDLAARLADALGPAAAVTDQSEGRGVVRLSGSALTATLRKLVAIDVDPAIFTPGHTAITQIAHVGVQLIAGVDGAVTVILPRTFAGSLLHEIAEAGAFEGVEVRAG